MNRSSPRNNRKEDIHESVRRAHVTDGKTSRVRKASRQGTDFLKLNCIHDEPSGVSTALTL